MTKDLAANCLAGAGLLLLVASATVLHYAAGLAVAGVACVIVALGIVRQSKQGD